MGTIPHKGLLRKYMLNVPNTHKKSRRVKSGFSTVQMLDLDIDRSVQKRREYKGNLLGNLSVDLLGN
jgi:hypothetical protein